LARSARNLWFASSVLSVFSVVNLWVCSLNRRQSGQNDLAFGDQFAFYPAFDTALYERPYLATPFGFKAQLFSGPDRSQKLH
jgi:hypothetical protein